MKSWIGPRTVYVDCYDALGFFEENYERVMIVMSAIGESTLLKREWVSGRAGGGSWARTLRCVFKTDLDPVHVKTMMVGLQYLGSNEVHEDLPTDDDTGLFRFAKFDVFEARESESEEKGRFRRMLKQPDRKIEMSDLEVVGDTSVFIAACRDRLLQNIDESSRQKLLDIEEKILEKLEAEEAARR
ncbi:MAG: hypothetical protein ACXADD_17905 [Candidatus Thorarchaeota archaeon]|jgi:hypothetical protein